jgi:acyl-CoA reductase-like NAD-dependent aldehyde dehydrogenase
MRDVLNPFDGSVAGRTAIAAVADVQDAVGAALAVQASWQEMSAADRNDILSRAAELIRMNAQDIAEQLTAEQGKPVTDSLKEILFGARVLEYYGQEAIRLAPEMRATDSPHIRSIVRYAALGVVGAIVPWNYPVDLLCWKVAPALAMGNCVIVKPPVEAPLAIAMVIDLIHRAGVPNGVLADLPGDADVGEAIVRHPDISMISATCSTRAGQAIMSAAAAGTKRLTLELGGSSPFIVLPTADIQEAARAATRRSFSNSGQICIAVNRIIVTEELAEEFVEAMAAEIDRLAPGNGADAGVTFGPATTVGVLETAERHASEALQRGATLIRGGKRLSGPGLDKGNFFAPTLLDGVSPASLVVAEETFGPVAAIQRVSTVSDAVATANTSPYGLAAYVYADDLELAWSVAERVHAGGVGVNVNDVTELQAPFGGWKLSGYGRELGREGLLGFAQTQHIRLRLRDRMEP